MNGADLIELKCGGTNFDRFARRHANYVGKLACWFHRRAQWCAAPVDEDDLAQIGLLELWHAVDEYRWRCPSCRRSAGCPEAFDAHVLGAHGRLLSPRPTILTYVHARVGRSMDHEMRRHMRRHKHHGEEPPEHLEPSAPPTQEQVTELAQLVEAARAELDPVRQQVLAGLALGVKPRDHGVAPATVARIREELWRDFLEVRAC